MVTLYAGFATRELAYAVHAGEAELLESSEWDGPVECPVERAEFEILAGPLARTCITVGGQDFLKMQEAEAIEGVFNAMLRGVSPRAAVDNALLVARATL